MDSRTDIQKIALQKLKDAELLYDNGSYDNAFYLAGYCVELALKARICKNISIDYLFAPNSKHLRLFKTHDFDVLIVFSGLSEKLEEEKALNSAFYKNWEYICGWKEDCRYGISGSKTQAQALEILDAIRHPTNGFLKWIKKYW